MSDGYWRIKQYSPTTKTGFMITSIPITESDTTGQDDWTEPRWFVNPTHIEFHHQDGHKDLYPWASIVKAEYQPPTP